MRGGRHGGHHIGRAVPEIPGPALRGYAGSIQEYNVGGYAIVPSSFLRGETGAHAVEVEGDLERTEITTVGEAGVISAGRRRETYPSAGKRAGRADGLV